MKDYYKILGVNKDCTLEEIKSNFRSKALKLHPDKSGANTADQFIELFEAYSILSSKTDRDRYNLIYEFIDTGNVKVEKEPIKDILAIESRGTIYSKDFNLFDKEVLSLIAENVYHASDKLVLVSLYALVIGIITIIKGVLNFDLIYFLIGVITSFIGLFFGVLKINWNKNSSDDWSRSKKKEQKN